MQPRYTLSPSINTVDLSRWSLTSSTTVSRLTLCRRTLAARRAPTAIAGAEVVTVALDTDPRSEIVNVSRLRWVLNLIRRRPALTTSPLASDLDDGGGSEPLRELRHAQVVAVCGRSRRRDRGRQCPQAARTLGSRAIEIGRAHV